MQVTYAVSWEEPDGSTGSGRLELGPGALVLHGRNGAGALTRSFPYGEMQDVRVGRAPDERLGGRPTLVVELASGGLLRVAGVAQPGIVAELSTRLSALRHDPAATERLALVVPLKPGSRQAAEALLAGGPPFDPRELGLDHHEVFLTESEAVFVFEGVPAALLGRSAENDTIWAAAGAWEPLIDGRVRFAERAYAWPD
jgi:hypothetical protein